ncbi:hypothetical protein ACOSQ4_027870 [Xanthoceras sorbifolium]
MVNTIHPTIILKKMIKETTQLRRPCKPAQDNPIFVFKGKDDFTKKYAGGKSATAVANSLNKEFGPKLKEQMQYCVDHPEEVSKLAKVKAQVSEVKGVMMENIEKVLDRGEKIELLVDKTENLRSQVSKYT